MAGLVVPTKFYDITVEGRSRDFVGPTRSDIAHMKLDKRSHGASSRPGWWAARLFCAVYRFQTLRIANRVFSGVEGSTWVRRSFFGKDLYLDVSRSNAQRRLWLEGQRFMGERRLLRRLVQPGMTVVDIGANIGYYALFLLSVIEDDGHLICVEPDPNNLVELSKNLQHNDVSNVEILHAAAGAKSGVARIELGLNAHISDHGSWATKMVAIDDLDTKGVDFLKIDVEGYEGAVLDGARETLRFHRPIVFLELHPHLLTSHSHWDVMERLEPFYPNPEAFEVADSWRGKVRNRYGGGGVERVDAREVITRMSEGNRERPVWIVCEPVHPYGE